MALKLLITSGATREPIDQVRYVSNVSTGGTGARLADFFLGLGFEVTYLHGVSSVMPESDCECVEFTECRDLDSKLRALLSSRRYFAVVQLAAISDYSVDEVFVAGRAFKPWELRKVDSGESLELRLKRNEKIVPKLKTYGGERLLVVAFKLTNTESVEERAAAVERLARLGGIDWIAHNDLGELRNARRGGQEQAFRLMSAQDEDLKDALEAVPLPGVSALGGALVGAWREKNL